MRLNVTFSEDQKHIDVEFDKTPIVKSQTKNVTPTFSQEVVLPDEGYEYLAQVIVAPIPFDLRSLTVTPDMLAEGVVAIGADGSLIVGTAKVVTLGVLGEGKLGLLVI